MKILHNMIVYPKVKIYSSRSSADNFDDYVLYLYYLFILRNINKETNRKINRTMC